jgi:hypothetical protein
MERKRDGESGKHTLQNVTCRTFWVFCVAHLIESSPAPNKSALLYPFSRWRNQELRNGRSFLNPISSQKWWN